MLQVVLEEPGQFTSSEAMQPRAREGEALVRVRRIGVCGTDLHAFAGRQPFFGYPRILGHELGVEVLQAPPNDKGIGAGSRCAVEPYLSCGVCRACRIGKRNCCERIEVLGVHTDGGMREFMTISIDHLYKSDRLSFDQLALIEMLGVGAHAVERSGLQEGEEALVVGAGPIGLAVTQFALAIKAQVRVLEIKPARRQFLSALGVNTLPEPDEKLADVVFDATGNPKAMEQSLLRVAPGGRLVFVGLVMSPVLLDDPLFHRREVTLFASRNSVNQFPRVIDLVEQGAIDTTPWITHRMKLSEVSRRFPEIRGLTDCVKAVIEVGEGAA
jgi:2-desacetyl-2-hydroxyethyl bacteriochlorophyllide A dehydrogenase